MMHIVSLRKNDHTYIILYEPGREDDALWRLGHMAADEELEFTWDDAGMLSQRVKELHKGTST